jgi:hypothetical protein
MADSLSAKGIVYPGDFSLIALTLLAATDSYRLDIKNILEEISYQEDLFSDCVYGYVNVTDAEGYIEKLSISGNEFLRLQLGKGDNTNYLIDKLFRVYKIAKRKPEGQGMTESYCLYFCSEEMLISEQYKVLKSYQSKGVSDIINDIMQNYLKIDSSNRTSGDLEQTYGSYDFIIPNLKPFDAINWLCTYARPMPPNTGADMLFFEDKDGFKLRSLQTMYQQTDVAAYNYSPKNVNPITKEPQLNYDVGNAITYEIMDSFDTLGAINSGALANSVLNVDILGRRASLQKFDYVQDYVNKATQLNDQPGLNSTLKNRFGDAMNSTHLANFKLVYGNSGQANYVSVPSAVAHDIFAEVFIPNRTAQLPLSSYMRAKLSVWGNPQLTVGKTITFNLLTKDIRNTGLDSFYSGRYIITAVRHLLTFDNYRTVIEIAKDSNPTQYNNIDNSSALWQNTVKGIK